MSKEKSRNLLFNIIWITICCLILCYITFGKDVIKTLYENNKLDSVMRFRYVDLGLQSGTKWCVVDEEGTYKYEDAIIKYKDELPTLKQFNELIKNTKKEIVDDKYVFIGPNGKKLYFPYKPDSTYVVLSNDEDTATVMCFGDNYVKSYSYDIRFENLALMFGSLFNSDIQYHFIRLVK